jgi:hypothetical protein
MSSRAFLNSFMLCPRLRAKSGNFFAPKRTRTMRRMINRSGPPRLPIPNARIFITILNWSGPMLYSPRTGGYSLYNAQITLYDLEPKPANRRRSASHLVRLSLLGVGALLNSIPLQFRRRDVCAHSLVAGFKTAAFPDLQKLSGLPHSRRRQPRIRIHHVPNAKHCSHPS